MRSAGARRTSNIAAAELESRNVAELRALGALRGAQIRLIELRAALGARDTQDSVGSAQYKRS